MVYNNEPAHIYLCWTHDRRLLSFLWCIALARMQQWLERRYVENFSQRLVYKCIIYCLLGLKLVQTFNSFIG